MDSYNYLLTVFILHWVALLSPGANVLLVTHLAGNSGRRLAVYASLGISTATLIWSSSSLFGLAVLISKFPLLREFVQISGSLYLAYIGFKILHSTSKGDSLSPKAVTVRQAYLLGFNTNILNPKSAIFFVSVFGTTLPVNFSAAVGISAIGIVMFNVLAWHCFLAYCFSTSLVRSIYLAHIKIVNTISGSCLLLISIKLFSDSLFRLIGY